AVVFVVAACGLVYELALISLGAFLLGSSIHQTSIVLGVMVCAMGVGSLLAKRLTGDPVVAFATVELALGVAGGLSVLGLYSAFAWLSLYTAPLIAASALLGMLIGIELPLLMRLLQRIRPQEAGEATSDLFAADYLGALVGGLAFPFLLLPRFGQLHGALAVGALNVVCAAVIVFAVFGRAVSRRALAGIGVGFAVGLGALGVAALGAGTLEVNARQALFEDPITTHVRTRYQDIVITEAVRFNGRRDLRLFLNGDLQFASLDEYRYHEALVHPALAGRRANVLILGGGDGLALREVLRYPDVEAVTLVELDPEVIRLARDDDRLRELNQGALRDRRVTVETTDAFNWLRTVPERFDAIVVDMPDADDVATAKLYSVEFYELVANALAPQGQAVIQAGSPFFAPEAFWSIEASVRAAGLLSVPYHVDVPSFGDWGFVAASADGRPLLDVDPAMAAQLRFLDRAVLSAATVFALDRQAGAFDAQPSTLTDPRILDYSRKGWQGE
ncbi:MAG: polyamine aminopropyltransferase, partial [Acidimicrobiales bacterium]|nr:polyamine aminopropyltransferase [Acidimicrobiales bacterium]